MRGKTDKKNKTVSQVVAVHHMALLHETSVTAFSFIATVREHYEASHNEHSRSIHFHSVKDPTTQATRDAEKFKRWLSDDLSGELPANILPSIKAAFPPERRLHLQTELAALEGMYVIPMAEGKEFDGVNIFAYMFKESGEAVSASANLFENKSKTKIDVAKIQLLESISAQIATFHYLCKGDPSKDDAVVFGVDSTK